MKKLRDIALGKWFLENGDGKIRLDYILDRKSVVLDVGGGEGVFCRAVNENFGCEIYVFDPVEEYYDSLKTEFKDVPNVHIFPHALSNKNTKDNIYVYNISSSMHTETIEDQPIQEVQCITMDKVLSENRLSFVDLVKINIEGEEYNLLEYMIKKDLVHLFDNIQVQFHRFIKGYRDRYRVIRDTLEKTHYLTYKYPYVWENWRLKDKSYSQVGQDLFVLSLFPEGYKGTFLDIGCQLPRHINNTLLLEERGWNGTSIDYKDYSKEWRHRNTRYVCTDALNCDYVELEVPLLVDYLSLDISQYPGARYDAISRLFEQGFEFNVITIEHDAYLGYDKSEREPQRKLLKEHGYKLYSSDISSNGQPFEDWWINPNHINEV